MPEPPAGFDNVSRLLADELGVTYLADQASGRPVALRLLTIAVPNRTARRQFRSSCLGAAVLTGQPGILALHEADFTDDHHPYLVTDPPTGTLAVRLGHGPMRAPLAASVGVRLAAALATAHAAGVLHLDVRPANVVTMAPTGVPLLAYFGVSRAVAVQAEPGIECLLHAGRELFGWDTPGPAADVYGLASTLYAMLAGQAPYAAEARLGRAALYQRVLRGGPPPIARPGIPPQLTSLITAMMDPDPGSRPALAHVTDALTSHASVDLALTTRWDYSEAAAHPRVHFERIAPPVATPEPVLVPADPAEPILAEPAPLLLPTPAPSAPSETPAPPAPPAQPVMSEREPTPDRERTASRIRPTGPMLLIAAGLLALLAGFVWGIVTGSHSKPQSGPTVRATSSASPIGPGQLALYRARNVRVSARPSGIVVTWSAPSKTTGVTAFLVVAKVPGRPRTQVVGHAHSAVFAGLPSGHRYCFVVGTLIESPAGQASTATTRPVCVSSAATGWPRS